jgi:hypothetical protein
MQDVADTIAYFAAALLYPVLTGPVAAYLLVFVLKQENRRLMLLYWPLLIAFHVAGYWLMMRTLGDWGIGPGFISCLVTPIVAASTALGLRLAPRRWLPEMWEDPARRAWLTVATFVLPLLQGITVFTLVLFAPSR